ncbi:hypothetical protein B5F78_12195 [Bacteroides sp. An279]|nr:hypothetical protein B5F78_12195 [Bacteroides sp. An279]
MRRFFFRFVFIEYPHFAQLAVGAYCIRLENIHVDKCVHSGVCDTPLHGLFADIHIVLSLQFLADAVGKLSRLGIPCRRRGEAFPVWDSLPTLWGSFRRPAIPCRHRGEAFAGLQFLADTVGKLSQGKDRSFRPILRKTVRLNNTSGNTR